MGSTRSFFRYGLLFSASTTIAFTALAYFAPSPTPVGAVPTVTTTFFLTATSTSNWTVPLDWNPSNNTVDVIGGGQSASTGSGGGGAYSGGVNLALTPGATVQYRAGGPTDKNSWFNAASFAACTDPAVCVRAQGGSGSTGGQASQGVGTVKYSGGNGSNGLYGGGGAAGPSGNGGNASSNGGTANGGLVAGATTWGKKGNSQALWTQSSNGVVAGPGSGGSVGQSGISTGQSGQKGGNGGAYGGGGGKGGMGSGGGSSPGGPGLGTEGIIVVQYTTTIGLTLSASNSCVGTPGTFVVTRNGPTTAIASGSLTLTGGTAVSGVDYQPFSFNFTIPVGQASVSIPVTMVKRNITGSKTLSAQLVPSVDYDTTGTPTMIIENGVAPQAAASLSGYTAAPFIAYPYPIYTGGAGGNSAIDNVDGSGSWPGPSYFSDDPGSYNDSGGNYGDLSGYSQPILPVAARTMGLAWFNGDPLPHSVSWYAGTPSPLTCYSAYGSNYGQGQGKCMYFGDKKGSRIEAIVATTSYSLNGEAGADLVSTQVANACGETTTRWQYVTPSASVFKVPKYTQVTTQLSCQPNQSYLWKALLRRCPFITCYNVNTIQQRIFRFADRAIVNSAATSQLTSSVTKIVSDEDTFTLQCGGYLPEEGTQVNLRPQLAGYGFSSTQIDDFSTVDASNISPYAAYRYDPLAAGVKYPPFYNFDSTPAQWNGPQYWPWTWAYYNTPDSSYYHPEISLTVEACPGDNEIVVGGVCTACVAPTSYRSGNTCISTPSPTATISANGAPSGEAISVAVGQPVSVTANYAGASGAQVPQTVTVTTSQTWTVPPGISSPIQIEVWGAGGGGAGDGSPTAGTSGGNSTVTVSGTTLSAGGGVGTDTSPTGMAGGAASGGDVNTNGNAGDSGTTGVSGRGGDAPLGGTGGSNVSGSAGNGGSGNAPGGGGGGAYYSGSGSGGGGSGAYVKKTYASEVLTTGTQIPVVIGTGGTGGGGSYQGGNGATGRVVISYTASADDTLTATAINNDATGATVPCVNVTPFHASCETQPDASKTYTFTPSTPDTTLTFSAQAKTTNYTTYNGYATVEVRVCPAGQDSDGSGGCVEDECTNNAEFPGAQASVPAGCTQEPVKVCVLPEGYAYNGTACVPAAPPLPTLDENSFTATRVRLGGSSTLSWDIQGMAAGITCNISPVPASGTQGDGTLTWNGSSNPFTGTATTPAINQPTKYTLTCTNQSTSASKSVIVNIVPTYQEI